MPPVTDGRRILITLVVCLASVMQGLDGTITNIALPFMQSTFAASQDQIAWVITSYVVGAAVMIAISGYMADRFGQLRVFVFSVVGFTVTSVLCGTAQSLSQIVLFRLIQGLCGACVVPLSQSVLLNIWPREKHGQAMAIWGMGVTLAPILGPTLGGYLTDTLNWRWVFLVNIPFGIICTIGLLILLPDTQRQAGKYFNAKGFGYIAVALCALQLALDRGQTLDWLDSREIVIEFLTAAVCFYLFLMDMFTAKRPFMDPIIFRDRNFVIGIILTFLSGFVLWSVMVLWPNMLETLMGYPVLTAGMLMLPRGVGAMVAMGVAGNIVKSVGVRPMMLIGISFTVYSYWLASGFTLDTDAMRLAMVGFVQGAGTGLIFVPINALTYSTLDNRYMTQAAVCFSLVRNVSTSMGISIMVTLFSHNAVVNHAVLSEAINVFSPGLRGLVTSAASTVSPAALAALEGEVARQAAMTAYCDNFRFMAYTLAALSVLVILSRPGKNAAAPIIHEI
ncbi:MAG: DHA2 family efflux MFS transporter permease subunit [Rhodospirillaceae bacterium]|nr:MAG: DHA2 family efflux MFS transporter permease subunit [Rhodospirillaceae bacterium]